ncbi:ketoacyl-synt-domain-containing protein [Biscogniauxia mediterranea]|nr:ketoacyl-synt-domain-containing protein [Biscogniauxia mediterranea]
MPPRIIDEKEVEGNSTLEPVAICGMACRLPGGVDSDSSFWKMLVEKRTGQTPKVPEDRFNIDAHYHKNLERPGSFNVLGGYFLQGRLQDFDPSFFNITPVEALWLDPQQRKMLEVSYECMASAGITLDSVAGSNTAVFVGSFTADYQQMSTREPDFRHNYAATGVDPGIISNRIGHTFDLRGPSFTINTACSSSIYALHNACHALRARDCDAAIVGGVNLILTVDQHMNTAKLGILSPTSTCHTFDAAADGYGRSEAAGALYLKRLSDAIRDGDPIRGVIRSTAVNTNGKVDGMGITHPSVEGQERVLRMAYEKAGLNQNLTAYAELHGTGTPVGDPIEVRAVSRAMNDTRPKNKPLLIGAVKPNIGHSEAASGIFAVMKAALMTEAAVIPGVALLKNLNPAILEKEWNVKVHRDTTPWPSDSLVRRASVSSFGYGGTNGHVVVESIESTYHWYQHGKAKNEAPYDHSCSRPLLLTHSAHDRTTLLRNVAALAKVAPNYYLADLAHTLNLHRTKFKCRAFVVAREDRIADTFEKESQVIGNISQKGKEIGFLFTGQGAQWAGMAKKAYHHFLAFAEAIHKLDLVLRKLESPPEFSITELLLDDTETMASIINEPHISQLLCTAVQISLVDLFALWGVVPQVSVGHSSGEIAAAYAAGLVSAPEAILAAYCRGFAVQARSGPGSMLAVGLGAEEVRNFLPADSNEANLRGICIACENSPNSVTLSGESEEIAHLQKLISSEGIFARELRTGRAYHSPHMSAVGDFYDELLNNAITALNENDLKWRRPRSHMVSSVTGELITTDTLPKGYFSANLRNKVRFNTAVELVGTDKEKFGQVSQILEIGPHMALSGPFKQICSANKFDRFTYTPTLVRNKDDADQILSAVGNLFIAGYPMDLEAVNAEGYGHADTSQLELLNIGSNGTRKGHKTRKPKTQYLEYWAESRASKEQRARMFPRHDLLGSRVSGLSERTRIWRNVLRHRDVPWLKHHSLGGTAIFPAAGHLAIAIEALRQVCDEKGIPFDGGTLRNVAIDRALTLPDNDDGVEIITTLQQGTSSNVGDTSGEYSFSVESLSDGEWVLHCTGSVSVAHQPNEYPRSPVDASALGQRATGKTWYEAFRRVGFHYGPSFQQLRHAQTDRRLHHAVGDVNAIDECMDGESRSLIHPATVDACIQLIITSVHAGRHKKMPWGVVPTHIEEATIFPAVSEYNDDTGSVGRAVVWTDDFESSSRRFNTSTTLTGKSGRLLLHIKNITCTAYEAAIPASTSQATAAALPPEPFSLSVWKPDITTLTAEKFEELWPQLSATSACARFERLAKLLELISHRQSLDHVFLVCDHSDLMGASTLSVILDTVPHSSALTLAFCAIERLDKLAIPEKHQYRLTIRDLSSLSDLWGESSAISTPPDLILIDTKSDILPIDNLLSLVNVHGWVIGSSQLSIKGEIGTRLNGSITGPILEVGREFAVQSLKPNPGTGGAATLDTNGVNGNGHISGTSSMPVASKMPTSQQHASFNKITLLSPVLSDESRDSNSLNLTIGAPEYQVSCKPLLEFNAEDDHHVVIDDTDGLFLLSGIDEARFTALKRIIASGASIVWLTRGVRQGKNPTGGMAEGFLRVIRSEQAASKIMLLDVDEEEPTAEVSAAVLRCLDTACTKESGNDTEFWLHHGTTYVSRVYPNYELNQHWNMDNDDSPIRQQTLSRVGPRAEALPDVKAAKGTVASASEREAPAGEHEVLSNGATSEDNQLAEPEPKANVVVPLELRFRSEATYLLVGCLGGLGRSLTRFMTERGARHFAFLSRTGADKPEAARTVAAIRAQAGCSAQVFRVDASDAAGVRSVVAALDAQPRPIRGVVHAAMVLRDGTFDGMDAAGFGAAVAPKARGALALHGALGGGDVDFFVMTSSVSAVLGNPGQANYGAANSCLDALALHRRAAGLAAASLALPMVLDVGAVAEDASGAVEASLARRGLYGVDEEEMLRGFEAAVLRARDPSSGPEAHESQLIMGMDAGELARAIAKAGGVGRADVYWYRDARLCHVRAALEARAAQAGESESGSGGDGDGDGSFAESLKAALAESPAAALEAIAVHIAKRVSSVLMIPVEDFELEGRSIASYGLDSMIGAEMRSWLFREFGLDFPFQQLLAPTLTFRSLAARAGESMGLIKT